jgi:ketosteroid isomerase-like protein
MENEIRRVIAELGRAIGARDFDAAVACFSAEAVLLMPGQSMVSGLPAIRAALEGLFGGGAPQVEVTVMRVVVAGSGDLAYAFGTGVTQGEPPHGGYRSKWIAVLRREGQGWRIVADTFNADAAELG